jgi:hypothetical protein
MPEVWHAPSAPEPVRFAASELARYLSRLFDESVVVSGAAADAWPSLELRVTPDGAPTARPALESRLAAQVQPVPPAFNSPGADAFVWQTGDGRAAVLGTNPRSTLYGVYDLLEELGCRFFSPDPNDELVPRLDGRAFDDHREHFEQATFAYRERHLLEWIDAEATRNEIDHAAKRRLNGFTFHIEDFAPDPATWRIVLDEFVPELARRGLMPGLGEHGGYVLFLPPERYASDHPDWYAEIDGRRVARFGGDGTRYQFCTEHPEARATFLANLAAFLRDHPLIQIMHIAPEDVGCWCECERCRPISIADRYLRLDNAIAAVVRRVRPDASVTHLVYANHVELPERERPAPGLKVSFVPFGRDFRLPFTDPAANMALDAHPWSLDLIQDWARLCQAAQAGLIEHTKASRHRWITFRLLPLPHLQADMRWWRGIGANGFNAPQEGEGWWVKHLNAFVHARLMWELDASVDDLLDDYFERYWRGIGDEVRELYVAIAEALPNLAYARNQPALLQNRAPDVRLPPAEQWASDAQYLERAIARLREGSRRLDSLQGPTVLELAVQQRLAKLAESIEGALAGLRVSLVIRRYLLARGGPHALEAASTARAAHARFVAWQTPERLRAGTLWTGRWQREETFAAWEREASATPA